MKVPLSHLSGVYSLKIRRLEKKNNEYLRRKIDGGRVMGKKEARASFMGRESGDVCFMELELPTKARILPRPLSTCSIRNLSVRTSDISSIIAFRRSRNVTGGQGQNKNSHSISKAE